MKHCDPYLDREGFSRNSRVLRDLFKDTQWSDPRLASGVLKLASSSGLMADLQFTCTSSLGD